MNGLVGKTITYTAPSGHTCKGTVDKEFKNEVEIKEIGQLSGRVWRYRIDKSQIVSVKE